MGQPARAANALYDDDATSVETLEAIEANGAEIWARVRARVEQQLAIIELQAHRLLDRPLSDDETAAASAAAASLARGLGTLRQHSLAQLARHIESTLGEGTPDATTGVHLAGTVEDLRTMLASAIAQLENGRTGAGQVLAIGTSSAHFDALLWYLASRGHHVLHEGDALPDPDDGDQPAAIVAAVGTTFNNKMRTILRAAAEAYRAEIIVLHDNAPLAVQCRLASYCSTLFPLSTPPDTVSEEIVRQRAARHADLTALVCGADEAGPVLEAHGFDVTIVPQPDDLMAVAANDGTAVVFGSAVPSRLVLALTRLIRATPAARKAPVVWEGDHKANVTLQAQRLGIMISATLDDGVAISIAAQMRQAAADVDLALGEAGGLLSWPAAQVLIDRSLVAAQRSSTATSLATIEVSDEIPDDHLGQINEMLTREFRRSDIVGERGERRFVVALQGAARRVGVTRMAALAPRLAPDGIGIRVGIAEFPSDGRSAEELVAAADSAVAHAVAADGPAVVSTMWRNEGERAVDVLIVDPDPILSEMVFAMLSERGYQCDRLTDGRDALERLTTSSSDALPRVLMLDVDVGGVDGLTLLRSLRPSGVLAHMEVLVVSARAAESDIRMAFDFGAAEIIRKPFSATLLAHRVGRLLER